MMWLHLTHITTSFNIYSPSPPSLRITGMIFYRNTVWLYQYGFEDIFTNFFPFIILFSESTADKRAWRLRHSQRRAGTALIFRIVVRRTLWYGRRDRQREYYCFMFLSLSVRVNVCVDVTCVSVLYNYHVNPKPFCGGGVCARSGVCVFLSAVSSGKKPPWTLRRLFNL